MSNLLMADAAVFNIIGWPGNESRVSRFFRFFFIIAFVTGNAFQGRVKIFAECLRVDHIPFIIFFRPNWGRSSRSPLALAFNLRRFYQSFHVAVTGMAFVTTATFASL